MTGILNLAKNFQTASEKKAINTGVELEKEFQQHAASMRNILNESVSIWQADMAAHHHQMRRFVLKTWAWLGLTILLLLGLTSSLMWWAGSILHRDAQSIIQQQQTLESLGAEGYTFLPAQNGKPAYLVLPKNVTEGTLYTSKTGQRVIPIGTKKQLGNQ